MAKVTSKLQVTIPKVIADQYDIAPGDEIDFEAAGPVIRVVPPRRRGSERLSRDERTRLFDASTVRQREREARFELPPRPTGKRDWTREELYTRGDSG